MRRLRDALLMEPVPRNVPPENKYLRAVISTEAEVEEHEMFSE